MARKGTSRAGRASRRRRLQRDRSLADDSIMRIWIGWVVAALALGSCAKRDHVQSVPALTERQRDSVLARSALPGASVVGRAIEISDRSAKSASQPPPVESGDE
jgi:hypothetical protein